MAYVPGFQHDIFVSYASENDADGWVRRTQEFLGRELRELLGRQFDPRRIYYYPKSKELGDFPSQLSHAAQDSAILMPVVSPVFLSSVWCDREWLAFAGSLPRNAGVADCVAPIRVRPVEALPQHLRNIDFHDFVNSESREPWQPGTAEWAGLVRSLAGRVKQRLEMLRRHYSPIFVGRAPSRDPELRDRMVLEFQGLSFRPIPDFVQELNDDRQVDAALRDSVAAVLFAGTGDESLELLERATALCAGPTFFYVPFGTALHPDEDLLLSKAVNAGAKVHAIKERNEQEFRIFIEQELTANKKNAETPPPGCVRLVCEAADLALAEEIGRAAENETRVPIQPTDFLNPSLSGLELLRRWKGAVRSSRALIYIHGLSREDELIRLENCARRERPDLPSTWCVAPPDEDGKRSRRPEALTAKAVSGFVRLIGDAV